MAAVDELNTSITARMEELRTRERYVTDMERVATERAVAVAGDIESNAFKAAEAVRHKAEEDAKEQHEAALRHLDEVTAAIKRKRSEAEQDAAQQREAARLQLEHATEAIKLKQSELASSVAQHRAEMEKIKAERLAEHAKHIKRMQAAEAATTERLKELEEQSEAKQMAIVIKHATKMADKEAQLSALAVTEKGFQDRLARVTAAVGGDGARRINLSVMGVPFATTAAGLAREPQSVLAALLDGGVNGTVDVIGDPSLFHLVVAYLLDGKLPVVADASQLLWLERQAEGYHLDKLAALCRDGYSRLTKLSVMQLLNGQRNLSGMDMRDLDLSSIDFQCASLYCARLRGARLDGALLNNVNATSADFTDCSMEDVDAVGTQFEGADLTRASLHNALLTGANLSQANLTGSKLTDANLSGANLSRADITRSDLSGASLESANLVEADLSGADFTGSDLTGANLSKAKFDERTRASLPTAILKRVNFSEVDLSGVDLSDVDLMGFNFSNAKLNGVSWPTGKIVQGVTLSNKVMFSNDFGSSDFHVSSTAKGATASPYGDCIVALATAPFSQGVFWAQVSLGFVVRSTKFGVLGVPEGKRSGCAPIPACDIDLIRDGFSCEWDQGVTAIITLAFGSGKGTLTVTISGKTKTVDVPCASVVPYLRFCPPREGGHCNSACIESGSWDTCA
jgi:uncharacterized protein YjbI with pentapeptide repeats